MTDLKDIDPRGLFRDAYAIEGISEPECRSIFLDWAIGLPVGQEARPAIERVLAELGADEPDHPMTRVLTLGLAEQPVARRRGGRGGRVGK